MTFIPHGIIPPIITPFNDKGDVNYDLLAELSKHLVQRGVHGLFPLGTTGEFYAIDDSEFRQILITVRDAVSGMKTQKGEKIQLFAGCNHITTRKVIEQVKMVEEVGGYDAVSVLTPMFVSQTQDELFLFFKQIAGSTNLPVVLYNNRAKTNVHIEPKTVVRLAEKCPNIIAIKDSTGDMTVMGEYIRLTAHLRDHFNVLVGRDTMIFAGLMYGASGAIASCANLAPGLTADIYDKYAEGDLDGARTAQFELSPLRIATGLATFPQVIKEGLILQGFPVGNCLEPIQPMSDENREKLKKLMLEISLV